MSATTRAGVLAALALAAAAAGCGSTSSGGSDGGGTPAASGDTSELVVNAGVAPATIDPAVVCSFADQGLSNNLYSRLTQYGTKPGPDGTTEFDPAKIEPYAAKSWKVADAGKTYTFTLNAGMKFPSGKPVDAEAVKFSLERTMTAAGCGAAIVNDLFMAPPLIKSIEAPAPETLVIHLNHKDPNALQAWAQPAASIVDPSVVAEHGGDKKGAVNEWMQSHAAGAGPFTLESYEPNKQAVLTRNPDFIGDAPPAAKITVNYINSDPTLLLQAQSGDADVTLDLAKQSISSLKGNGNVRIIANESPMSEQIGLPNTKGPFKSREFREALSYALPYDQILEKVAFGYGTLFFGPLQPVFPEFSADLSNPRGYDPARAKELVAASGVKTPVDVEMAILEGNGTDEQIATIAQGEWKQLGVNLKLRKVSASDYITGLQAHKFDSYVRLDGPVVIDAGFFLSYDLTCKVGFNLTEACIPDADKLVAEARTLDDAAARKERYAKVTELWNAETPKITVYADQHVAVLGKDVKRYSYSPVADFRTWAR
jgi:peptide/nickel transport system substrate-binding protein